MYNRFFGFKDRPFQLVPNPRYLFLSKSHETALAHLTYALKQGDGFAAVTGEAGTGKTTVCRSFLNDIGEDVVAAYIFNPRLDAVQLLKAINDEFEIPSGAEGVKELIDRLNAFLLEQKAEGKKVILLIDEAQNLDRDVLEQVRLLSNLETATEKLLQIILVGQPELGEMLDAYDLRQLAQRISLSCHLTPLSYKETRDYIRHRITLASAKPGVRFTGPALKAIYRFSGGIPRLINVACDRCLLTAFSRDTRAINRTIAGSAVRELRTGRSAYRAEKGRPGVHPLAAIAVLGFVIAGLIFFQTSQTARMQDVPGRRPPAGPVAGAPAAAPDPVEPASPAAEPETSGSPAAAAPQYLQDALASLDPVSSRRAALSRAMTLWNASPAFTPDLDAIEDEQMFFTLAARQNGFEIYRFSGDLDMLKTLDLPAVMRFSSPLSPGSGFMLLEEATERAARLSSGDQVLDTETDALNRYWSGVAYIPWKNFRNLHGTIPRDATEDTILSLKMTLRELGFATLPLNADYDQETREAVETVQARFGLTVDGVAGPATKMALYKLMNDLNLPSISG